MCLFKFIAFDDVIKLYWNEWLKNVFKGCRPLVYYYNYRSLIILYNNCDLILIRMNNRVSYKTMRISYSYIIHIVLYRNVKIIHNGLF